MPDATEDATPADIFVLTPTCLSYTIFVSSSLSSGRCDTATPGEATAFFVPRGLSLASLPHLQHCDG